MTSSDTTRVPDDLRVRPEDEQEFDDRVEAFESNWRDRPPADWRDHLPPTTFASASALIVELIKVDLEYRCRQTQRQPTGQGNVEIPRLERYSSVLAEHDLLVTPDLIREEFHCRTRWADRPTIEEYRQRFEPAGVDVDGLLMDLCPVASTKYLDASGSDARSAALETLRGGQTCGGFRLISELGRGSFARVFLAQQVDLQRLVALKVSTSPSSEPRMLAKLDHPNIVRVFDERAHDGLYLLYMQYVPGGSLRRITRGVAAMPGSRIGGGWLLDQIDSIRRLRGDSVPISRQSHPLAGKSWNATVAWIGFRLAAGLSHAHQRGIWHRDLKPDNVLLAADGQPLLADFNLSFAESALTDELAQPFGGSLPYMSPEHLAVATGEADPQSVREASDLYSLAILLWELTTGTLPFRHDSASDGDPLNNAINARRHGPAFDELPADCRGGMRELLAECLRHDVADRPDDAASVARRFQLAGIESTDRLLYPDHRSWTARWRRHPIAWALSAGVAPNSVVSLVNIWANLRLTMERFDRQTFWSVQIPWVNLILYVAGVVFSLWVLRPLWSAIIEHQSDSDSGSDSGSRPDSEAAANRCLKVPSLIAGLILSLWMLSGILIPCWNAISPNSSVGTVDVMRFFLSQSLHGLIAATTTVIFLVPVLILGLLPKLLPTGHSPTLQRGLNQVVQLLEACERVLGLTPLLALLMLAGTGQDDMAVFLVLALVGFAGQLLSTVVTPRIRGQIQSLKLVVEPST